MQIDEDALPVVLMLLDQIYDLRRRMHALGKAIEHTTTGATRRGPGATRDIRNLSSFRVCRGTPAGAYHSVGSR